MGLFRPPTEKPIDPREEIISEAIKSSGFISKGPLTMSPYDPTDDRWWAELTDKTVGEHGDIARLELTLESKSPTRVASIDSAAIESRSKNLEILRNAGVPEEWRNEYVLQQWGEGSPAFDEEELTQQMMTRRDRREVGTYDLEDKTVGNMPMGVEPWYGDRALLEPKAAEGFTEMQRMYGKEIPIESAHRSETHNEAAGGADNSDHMRGTAIDITDPEALAWIKKYGKAFGWHFAHYSGNKYHFEYIGPRRSPGDIREEMT